MPKLVAFFVEYCDVASYRRDVREVRSGMVVAESRDGVQAC